MKKFLIMLLMVVLASFATPLFASDEGPPGVEKVNSTQTENIVLGQNGLSLVGAAGAVGCDIAKVHILHKDTLHYSWGEGIDINKQWTEWSNQNANMNLAYATVAVVRYIRGEIGV